MTKYIIISLLPLIATSASVAYGVSLLPTDREQKFIELGRFEQTKVELHSEANRLREQIRGIEDTISMLGERYTEADAEITILRNELFTPERPTPKSGGGIDATNYMLFTTYNPEPGQTDSTPCIGASGDDQCELATNHGARIIALSQDMVSHFGDKRFKYRDRVRLEQHPEESPNDLCNGEYEVLDTMNARFTNRGDIFVMDRSMNTSCRARIIISS